MTLTFCFTFLAEVSENGSRELAAQALLSMDSPIVESKSILIPHANTALAHSKGNLYICNLYQALDGSKTVLL